jgi:CubicO group peptidase (beta-lactamase class C family)
VNPIPTNLSIVSDTSVTRRAAVAGSAALSGSALLHGAPLAAFQATPAATPVVPADIIAVAEDAMAEMDLPAVLLHVIVDGDTLVSHALGESMAGVPATTDDHFRNGAVAIAYMATALLTLVDDGIVGLDDTIDRWLPDLPDAGDVTLRMLANMTSGYQDFVQNRELSAAIYDDPFRLWTPQELIDFGLATPRAFAPGTNWAYAHTDYVILGLVLEAISGMPLEQFLQERVLDPLQLTGTGASDTAWMPEPVLHAFTSERREPLGIPAGVRFYEESTYWSPSWTLARGAVQYTTIADMARTMEAIGTGALLSPEMHEEQVGMQLLGFGEPMEGCNNCHTQDEAYTYGLGVVHSRGWILQNPLFHGYGGTTAWHPEAKVAIAVETTYGEGSFDETGSSLYGNTSRAIFDRIAALLVPEWECP